MGRQTHTGIKTHNAKTTAPVADFIGHKMVVIGDKPFYIFSSIFYFLALMAWVEFDLPLEFIFAMAWQKPTGSWGIIMSGAFAILTDSVEPENLARRILHCRLLYRMTLALTGVLSGYIVDAVGKTPYLVI